MVGSHTKKLNFLAFGTPYQLGISNDEVCLGETEVSKDVCAENKPKSS